MVTSWMMVTLQQVLSSIRARIAKSAVCRWLHRGAALRTQLQLHTVSPVLEIRFRCDRRKPEQLLVAAAGALSVERPSLTSAGH
jgi:hypothetical protein